MEYIQEYLYKIDAVVHRQNRGVPKISTAFFEIIKYISYN